MIALGVDDVVARACEDGDTAAVVEMIRALYREDPGERDVDEAQARRTLRHFADHPERGAVLVLARADEPVGYALLVAFYSNEYGGLICVVDELYVRADLRGRGLASALVRAIAAGRIAPWGELVAIDLEVTPHNARARALYERIGFRAQKNAAMRWTPG